MDNNIVNLAGGSRNLQCDFLSTLPTRFLDKAWRQRGVRPQIHLARASGPLHYVDVNSPDNVIQFSFRRPL
jgi:hypothetical protein